MLQAVTITDTPCYAGNNEFTITVSQYVIVGVIEKNNSGNWVRVKVNEVVSCWVELRLLKFANNDLAFLPSVDVPPPQILTPTIISTPRDVITTPFPLLIRWKILSYDCFNDVPIGVTIDLDVEGGIPAYTFSSALPIYTKPGQFLEIIVYSDTVSREPSGTIEFTIPNAEDATVFKCTQSGTYLLPPLPPTDPPPIENTEEPQSTLPPVCYNPYGKIIPCH